MGVDAKKIGFFMWRILRFFAIIIYKCVQNHPIISSILVFLILLYSCFPSVFFFLIYSSPVLACAAVYVRIRLTKTKNVNIEKKDKEDSCRDSGSVNSVNNDKHDRAPLRPQRSVRRNARRKVDDTNTKGWESQASEDEKDKVILTTPYNDLLGRTPVFEDSPTKTTQAEESSTEYKRGLKSDPSLTDLVALERYAGNGGETTEVESDDDDDDEPAEETKKAVEWTEDDQKNLHNFGISEMERNQRLESLIARRRTRKLLKKAAENSLDTETTGPGPVSVSRNDAQNYFDLDDLDMPGSAPSGLLIGRSPFDLPYGQHAEKPNLAGASFHQEFAVKNQKDIFFTRHESFSRGGGPSQSLQTTPGFPGFGRHDTRTDNLFEKQQIIHEEESKLVENKHESNIENSNIEDTKTNSDKESASVNRSEVQHLDRNDTSRSTSPRENDSNDKSSNQSEIIPKQQKFEENLFYRSGPEGYFHAAKHSIASDLQVEVSEIGSSPTTIDENESSVDGESYTYDGDAEKDINWDISAKKDGILIGSSKIDGAVDSDQNQITSSDVTPVIVDIMSRISCSSLESISPKEKGMHLPIFPPEEAPLESLEGQSSPAEEATNETKTFDSISNIEETTAPQETNQNFDDSISLTEVPEPLTDRASLSPSSSTSPRSVLMEPIPTDQPSSFNLEEWENAGVAQTNVEETSSSGLLEPQANVEETAAQQLPENVSFLAPQTNVEETTAEPLPENVSLLAPQANVEEIASQPRPEDASLLTTQDNVEKATTLDIQPSEESVTLFAPQANVEEKTTLDIKPPDDNVGLLSQQTNVEETMQLDIRPLPENMTLPAPQANVEDANVTLVEQQASVEETATIDIKPPDENVSLLPPQGGEHLVEDAATHSSNNTNFENSKGPQDSSPKLSDETTNTNRIKSSVEEKLDSDSQIKSSDKEINSVNDPELSKDIQSESNILEEQGLQIDPPTAETNPPTADDLPTAEINPPTVDDLPTAETNPPTADDLPPAEINPPTVDDVPPTAADLPTAETNPPIAEAPVTADVLPIADDSPRADLQGQVKAKKKSRSFWGIRRSNSRN